MSQGSGGGILGWIQQFFQGDKQAPDDQARKLAEMEEQLALANSLSRIVISSSDLHERTELFAAELTGLVSIDWATIALIDRSTEQIHLSPFSSKVSGAWELKDALPMADTAVAWVAENQRALLEPDLKAESRFRTGSALLRRGIRTVLYMPLFARGEVFGSLMIGSKRPNAYGDRELKLLKYATSQLATVIENTRLFRESQEKAELQADFITALAHELKTPLTPIRASSELLAEELQESVGNSQARLAENIAHSAYSLDRKLSLMLELAKAQSSEYRLELDSLELEPVVRSVAQRCESELQGKGQTLELDVDASLPCVKANREQLRRVLTILVSNAVKFGPPGSTIVLRARESGREVVVEVQDSGEGFSEEETRHLFEVYYANGVDRQRIPELKLGLALSKRLVELQKGRLWVQSEPDKGSTFCISLPQA